MTSVRRRLTVSGTALVLAALLFRGQVAAALVMRGDDLQRQGNRPAAVRIYTRAVRIDPGSLVAADRLAFALVATRDIADARTARDVATQALARRPDAAELWADRGWADERLRAWQAAEDDFALAGKLARDPRYDHLAARCAQRAHRPADARRLFAAALAVDPRFAPARAALGLWK